MTDKIDSGPEFGSPLDFAVDQQSRITMATVRRAVSRGDAVLAYQPVVQSDRTDAPADVFTRLAEANVNVFQPDNAEAFIHGTAQS